jgi:hypothetical protein
LSPWTVIDPNAPDERGEEADWAKGFEAFAGSIGEDSFASSRDASASPGTASLVSAVFSSPELSSVARALNKFDEVAPFFAVV